MVENFSDVESRPIFKYRLIKIFCKFFYKNLKQSILLLQCF